MVNNNIHPTVLTQLEGLKRGVDSNRDGNLKGSEVKIFQESAKSLGIEDDTVKAYLEGFTKNGHIVQQGADESETAKLDRENFADGKSADVGKTSRGVKNKTVKLQQQCMRDLINMVKDLPSAQKAMVLSQMTNMPRPSSDISEYKQSLENWANTLLLNANVNISQLKLDSALKDGFEEQADVIKEENKETQEIVQKESEATQNTVKNEGTEIKKEVQKVGTDVQKLGKKIDGVRKEVVHQGELSRATTQKTAHAIVEEIADIAKVQIAYIGKEHQETRQAIQNASEKLAEDIKNKIGESAVDAHLLNVRAAMDRDNDYVTSNTTQRRFDNWLVLLAEQKKKGDPLYEEKCKQVAAWIDSDFNVTKENDEQMIRYIQGSEKTITVRPEIPEN